MAYFGIEFAVALAIGSVSLFADSIDFLEDTSVNVLILVALTWSAARRARVGMALAGRGYGAQLTKLATKSKEYEVEALGAIRLDTFIVTGGTRQPGDGHWESATYTQDEWNRAFGAAALIR